MAETSDPLSTEVAVEASLTDTGLQAKVKSRLMSAVDRLAGNLVDFVNLPVEASNSRKRAKMEAERTFIEVAGRVLCDRIEVDPQFAERAISNYLNDIVKKQENKDAVLEIAQREIKCLPAPETNSVENAGPVLDDDWLNFFEPIAGRATSESMRELFGRILSGEIRKPGAFSLSTLRVASELDRQTAQLFQELASRRYLGLIPSLNPKEDFGKFLDLEAAGLVNFGTGNLVQERKADDNKQLMLIGDSCIGVVETKSAGQAIQIPTVFLTNVGLQLASILPNDEVAALKGLLDGIKTEISAARLHRIISRQGKSVQYEKQPMEIIKQAEA